MAAEHPGAILAKGWIEALQLTSEQFATMAGLSCEALDELVAGGRSVTCEIAQILADATGREPSYWLDLQVRFDAATPLGQSAGRPVGGNSPTRQLNWKLHSTKIKRKARK